MRGFTLTEILVTLGIFSALVAVVAIAGTGDIRAAGIREDERLITSALTLARARSLSDRCTAGACGAEAVHGVYVTEREIVVFEGPSFESRNESADLTFPRAGRPNQGFGLQEASTSVFTNGRALP